MDNSSSSSDQIPWELDLYGQGQFTLHLGAPGLNFVWFHTLMKSLKEGREVMVLCFDLSPEHLEHVFRKNSIDLRLPEYAKLITIKYIMPSSSLLEIEGEGVLSKEEREKVKVLNTYYRCEHLIWDELKSMNWWNRSDSISESSAETQKLERCSLFIDDLHSLQIMATSSKQAKVFMHQLMNELNSDNTTSTNDASTDGNTINMLVCYASQMAPAQSSFGSSQSSNASPYLSEGEEVDFIDYCKYLANITVDIKPLTTGYSNDVHGMVEISAMINGNLLEEVRTFKNVNANTLLFSKLTSKV